MIINKIIHLITRNLIYKLYFKKFSITNRIIKPLRIDGKKNIFFGKKVTIGYHTWLASVPLTGNHLSELIFNDGVVIGNFNHIYSTKSIIFENDVLTADKVYIADNSHCYEEISIPINSQKIIQKNSVVIGEGSWIGENVSILGASIGKHCVIGANSVVTKNVPDYCVAVGNPAKIIKKYDFTKNQWRKTNPQGDFI